MKKTTITLVATLALLTVSQLAMAKGPSGRRGPPPEAFTACEGKSAGDTAEFSGRNGESVAGTCEERNGKLVLRPEGGRPDRGNRPERPES